MEKDLGESKEENRGLKGSIAKLERERERLMQEKSALENLVSLKN